MTHTQASAIVSNNSARQLGWIIYELSQQRDELASIVLKYQSSFPAFRDKPVGAPHSPERALADGHIVLEDQAIAALAKVTP